MYIYFWIALVCLWSGVERISATGALIILVLHERGGGSFRFILNGTIHPPSSEIDV